MFQSACLQVRYDDITKPHPPLPEDLTMLPHLCRSFKLSAQRACLASADLSSAYGFDVDLTVPKRRHFSTVLRTLPNDALQFLLNATVQMSQISEAPYYLHRATIVLTIRSLPYKHQKDHPQ
jgi:hypothetical protein